MVKKGKTAQYLTSLTLSMVFKIFFAMLMELMSLKISFGML